MKMKNSITLDRRTQFGILISMVIISSVLIFPFMATVFFLQYITVSGNNPILPDKNSLELALLLGVAVQTYVLVFSIKNLYKMIRTVKINELG